MVCFEKRRSKQIKWFVPGLLVCRQRNDCDMYLLNVSVTYVLRMFKHRGGDTHYGFLSVSTTECLWFYFPLFFTCFMSVNIFLMHCLVCKETVVGRGGRDQGRLHPRKSSSVVKWRHFCLHISFWDTSLFFSQFFSFRTSFLVTFLFFFFCIYF